MLFPRPTSLNCLAKLFYMSSGFTQTPYVSSGFTHRPFPYTLYHDCPISGLTPLLFIRACNRACVSLSSFCRAAAAPFFNLDFKIQRTGQQSSYSFNFGQFLSLIILYNWSDSSLTTSYHLPCRISSSCLSCPASYSIW